jgi:hypothetical protein
MHNHLPSLTAPMPFSTVTLPTTYFSLSRPLCGLKLYDLRLRTTLSLMAAVLLETTMTLFLEALGQSSPNSYHNFIRTSLPVSTTHLFSVVQDIPYNYYKLMSCAVVIINFLPSHWPRKGETSCLAALVKS